MIKQGYYRQKETGNYYAVIGNAINATNSNEHQELVLYKHPQGENIFAREINEFKEKFEFYRTDK